MKKFAVMGGMVAFLLIGVIISWGEGQLFALVWILVGAAMLGMMWQTLKALETPPETFLRLAERLGIQLESTWGTALDIRGGHGAAFVKRARGAYKGLRLSYVEYASASKVTLEHARPLYLGIFCHFNLPWSSQSRQGRPLFARKLASGPPWFTCGAVDRERAEQLLKSGHVQDALLRLKSALAGLQNGAFILDDRSLTVVSDPADVDESLLDAMRALCTTIQDSGLIPSRPPRGRRLSASPAYGIAILATLALAVGMLIVAGILRLP